MYLVSVIIPVYNTEKYLRECVDSVINQTYTNLEIILVDDGSTDSCPDICDEYANIDIRVHVIHKKNGGLSDARNTGIINSNGEFIMFVDSDDYIVSNTIETLVSAQKDSSADLIVFNFYGKYQIPFPSDWILCNGREALKRAFSHIAYVTAWSKLYHRSIFNSIKFPVGQNYEDTYICADVFMSAKSVYTINKYLYYYRDVTTGITGDKTSIKQLDKIYSIENLYNSILHYDIYECIPYIHQEILYFYVSTFGAFKSKNIIEKEKCNQIYKIFLKYRHNLWESATLVNKFAIILLCISPSLANLVFKFILNILK